MKRILTALALFAVACEPPPADVVETTTHAIQLIVAPQGPSNLALGVVNDGTAYIAIRDVHTGNCNLQQLGPTGTGKLYENVTVNMGPLGDSFEMPAPWASVTMTCNHVNPGNIAGPVTFHLAPLSSTDTHSIIVNGGAATDWIQCQNYAPGTTVACNGQGGDDHLETQYAVASLTLTGGTGFDGLHSTASNGGLVHLFGQGGDDCLDASPLTYDYDCGSDTGTVGQTTSVRNATCTLFVYSCPR